MQVLYKDEETAKQTLQDLGLTVNVEYGEDKTRGNGVVLKQSIESGKTVDEGSTITITVNKLAELKTGTVTINVKSITGFQDTYEETTKNNNTVAGSTETVKKENEVKKEEELILTKEAEQLKKELEKLTLVFKVKTGDKDKVFGSISPKQIKEELLKKGYKIDKKQIELITSLQSLGFHKVVITLYKEVKAELKVQLVK